MLGDPSQEMLATFTSSLSLNENMPLPFRKARDGPAVTKPFYHVGIGAFVETARF